jgi:hypothetical protein
MVAAAAAAVVAAWRIMEPQLPITSSPSQDIKWQDGLGQDSTGQGSQCQDSLPGQSKHRQSKPEQSKPSQSNHQKYIKWQDGLGQDSTGQGSQCQDSLPGQSKHRQSKPEQSKPSQANHQKSKLPQPLSSKPARRAQSSSTVAGSTNREVEVTKMGIEVADKTVETESASKKKKKKKHIYIYLSLSFFRALHACDMELLRSSFFRTLPACGINSFVLVFRALRICGIESLRSIRNASTDRHCCSNILHTVQPCVAKSMDPLLPHLREVWSDCNDVTSYAPRQPIMPQREPIMP